MGKSKEIFMEQREYESTLPSAPVKKTIYNIESEYMQLMSELENNEGEITPDIEARLQINKEDLEKKAVSYGYVIKQFDADMAQVQSEIERLTKIAQQKQTAQERLKTRISEAMKQFKVEKIQLNNLTLSFRKSESVVIDVDAKIPAKYLTKKVNTTIDKKGLKNAIKAGLKFKGISVKENDNLQIK